MHFPAPVSGGGDQGVGVTTKNMNRNSPDKKNHDLFDQRRDEVLRKSAPLADRMRPRTLEEFIGQNHILGEGRLLRRAIQIDQISSIIFYGPPGTGKTTLARIIAHTTKAQFLSINAVLAGVKDIREAIDHAQKSLSLHGRRTILFVDEVHRFNKAQQDALLPHVENGVLILIGATTENPYFEVNKALVSRSRIFQLRQLTEDDLRNIALQALADTERGFGNKKIIVEDDAMIHLAGIAAGDARGILNALELAVETTAPDSAGVIRITRIIAEESIQQRAVLYDRDGDAHFDTISAFIKSVRGSDADAALYWMAKMLYAGEDPRFIFRRLMILACEDVGMADPQALGVVVNAARAFDYVGLPEGRYHLAHACLYISTAPKSNSSMAFFDAIQTVADESKDDVPDHLRDASRDGEGFGHGQGYLYPHAYRDHWVAQQYLPETLQGRVFYQPSDQGFEKTVKENVERLRESQIEAMVDNDATSPVAGTDKAGSWTDRTLGTRGEGLGRVRERMIALAGIGRDSLALDLCARTGLLTFELLRRAPDGVVWALAHDEKSFETVSAMAKSLALLSQPQIVRTTRESFDDDVRAAAGKEVAFDTILGRNILTREPDKNGYAARIVNLLGADGVLVLAETVASQGQRVTSLFKDFKIDKRVIDILVNAESELFGDGSDPMVSWTVSTLEQGLLLIDGISVAVSSLTDLSKRRIVPQEIDYWFRTTDRTGRLSLGDRINDDSALSELKKAAHAAYDYREIAWKSVTAFIKITRKR